MNNQRLLSVIIPVYNEAGTIREILNLVEKSPVPKEIVIVDDGSTDGTRDILKNLPATPAGTARQVIFQEKNCGKGACIRLGVTKATGDFILIQDADLEYSPTEYPQLLAPLLSGEADVVYGSRYKAGSPRSPGWHTLVNKFLTGFSNCLTGLTITDMETCYKAFKADLIKSIPLRSDRFGFEPEITAKVAKLKARVVEVPISYNNRTRHEGKKINWTDGVSALYTMVKFSLLNDLKK
jgi:glycosyltransferase involved in cell wall biosynthesis